MQRQRFAATGKHYAAQSTTPKSKAMPQGDFVLIAADSLANSGVFETPQRKAKSSTAGSPANSTAFYEKAEATRAPRHIRRNRQGTQNKSTGAGNGALDGALPGCHAGARWPALRPTKSPLRVCDSRSEKIFLPDINPKQNQEMKAATLKNP